MNWYVQNRAHKTCVIFRIDIDFSTWELEIFDCLFHQWVHFAHQHVEIRHLFSVIYGWWWPSFMKILHITYPPANIFWFLVSALDRIYVHWSGSDNVFTLDIFQF